jgi:hypothetical protein
VLGLLFALFGLALAGSKGGYAACALGLAAIGVRAFVFRLKRSDSGFSRLGAVLGVLAITGPLAVVLARGMIGERLGELSILFRWFYVEGAARIVAAHPLFGVGPEGFQAAYMIHKPPISPEAVSSPHSVFFDFVATLGAGGWAWALLGLFLTIAAGRALLGHEDAEEESIVHSTALQSIHGVSPLRADLRFVAGILTTATLAASFVETPIASIESVLGRLAGLALGVICAAGPCSLMLARERSLDSALAATALVLIAHAQIEMTMTTMGSAALILGTIGLACGTANRAGEARRRVVSSLVALLPGIAGAAVLYLASSVWSWESFVRAAGRDVEAYPELVAFERRMYESRPESRAEVVKEAAAALARASGNPPQVDPKELAQHIEQFQFWSVEHAFDHLAMAGLEAPSHYGTARAESQMRLLLAAIQAKESGSASPNLEAGRRVVERYVARCPDRAAAWSFLGALWMNDAVRSSQGLENAATALAKASDLDPYTPAHAVALAQVYQKLGRTSEAASWAKKALELNLLQRLDPVQQLTEVQRERMESIASGK